MLVPFAAFAVVALGMLNFLWFMTETIPLNLIPSDRRVIDGHYVMWSKTHAGFVEVGADAYRWLPFHEATFFLSWPFVLLAGGTLVFTYFAGRIAGTSSPSDVAGRVASVRASGAVVVSARVGGIVGDVWFSRPLLRVTVHPGGVIVKPVFLQERALLAPEIIAATPGGGLSDRSDPDRGPVLGVRVSQVSTTFRPRGPFLRVDHTGVGLSSPLVIVGGRWDVAAPILAMSAPPRDGGHATAGLAAEPSTAGVGTRGRNAMPSPILLGGFVLGGIVTAVLVWVGITYAIPQLGLPGLLWTVGLIAIFVVNVRRYRRGYWR